MTLDKLIILIPLLAAGRGDRRGCFGWLLKGEPFSGGRGAGRLVCAERHAACAGAVGGELAGREKTAKGRRIRAHVSFGSGRPWRMPIHARPRHPPGWQLTLRRVRRRSRSVAEQEPRIPGRCDASADPLTSIMLVMSRRLDAGGGLRERYMRASRAIAVLRLHRAVRVLNDDARSVSNLRAPLRILGSGRHVQYLLIGFWYQKPEAVAAGKKRFLVIASADFGFALGLFLIWTTYGTLDYPIRGQTM